MSQNLTTLLQQLVRIPSVNPENDPGTAHTGEREIAIFLTGWLESIGAEVTQEEIRPGRPNLIARFAPMDGRPRILLGPQLDNPHFSALRSGHRSFQWPSPQKQIPSSDE